MDEEEEEVDNDEGGFPEPESIGHLMSTEGEIDGNEHGEDRDDDNHGETGEEELGVQEDGEYEDEEEGEEEVRFHIACNTYYLSYFYCLHHLINFSFFFFYLLRCYLI
ncbi:acidic leucine-rich nuclear phosphoprotein 32-related protein-like [Gossypium raimondii]|uniref:acidic leucine-rich nuclear phosphoprotein 32-related protein-like n=1 Tax=Gossypium raimondii TaxID=29730 RepID=UPI00227C37F9|nr:acidic leucine-rich nuclear phosphoprotein 32-related protein-like [Gossypium raimondii]